MINQENKSSQFALELKEISKIYPGPPIVQALSEISMAVTHGELLGIIGSSGSGKTTLLHIMGTLSIPSSGSIFIDGRNVVGMSDKQLSGMRSQQIGFVFQEFFLLPGFSALENVANGLLYSGIPSDERRERSFEMLGRVGLGHRANHLPNELSGGEQQRVAVARALVHNPAFVLADEPTGNLDSENTASLMELLTTLNEEGTTVILITHDLEVAESAQRKITLRDGRVDSDLSL
jgi:putative ABC transport system ATP-binding protein